MILGMFDFCFSASAALAPSKREQQWQQATAAIRLATKGPGKTHLTKTASTQALTQRGSVRTPGAQRLQGFLEVAGKGVSGCEVSAAVGVRSALRCRPPVT